MEKTIITMEAQEYIHKLEKAKMAAELSTKEALIQLQASDMAKLRRDFDEQTKNLQQNEDTYIKSLNREVID